MSDDERSYGYSYIKESKESDEEESVDNVLIDEHDNKEMFAASLMKTDLPEMHTIQKQSNLEEEKGDKEIFTVSQANIAETPQMINIPDFPDKKGQKVKSRMNSFDTNGTQTNHNYIKKMSDLKLDTSAHEESKSNNLKSKIISAKQDEYNTNPDKYKHIPKSLINNLQSKFNFILVLS